MDKGPPRHGWTTAPTVTAQMHDGLWAHYTLGCAVDYQCACLENRWCFCGVASQLLSNL